jgi:transposase
VAHPALVHLHVDVSSPSQLLDVVAGRSAAGPSAWLEARPEVWRAGIAWGVLDLSGPYRKTFTDALAHAEQVADPFHVVKLANSKLDECRRRVQNETLGHRGHKTDPLYRSRRLLTRADERLNDKGRDKLMGLLEAGDPRGEVRLTWHAKETVRGIYAIDDPDDADAFVAQLADDMTDPDHPTEVRSLGRTLRRWHHQIVAWHRARVSNGPTEATNNLIKRIKRCRPRRDSTGDPGADGVSTLRCGSAGDL